MNKKRSLIGIVVSTVLLLVLLVAVSAAFAGGKGGAPRVTTLSGAEEVPSADPDGSGFAAIRLNVGQETVCWELSYENLDPAPHAAHIHKAPAGSNGGVVVPLSVDPASGCRSADPALIQDIIDYPDQYYVNVHNAEFPGGAIRGQLSNPGQSH